MLAQCDVSSTLQLVASVSRYVEINNVINTQRVVANLVTVAERNLDWPGRCTIQCNTVVSVIVYTVSHNGGIQGVGSTLLGKMTCSEAKERRVKNTFLEGKNIALQCLHPTKLESTQNN